MKWYENDNGSTSAMRIMAMIVCIIGSSIVIFGAVTFFLKYEDSIQVMGVGTGLVTFSLGLKVWQKSLEI